MSSLVHLFIHNSGYILSSALLLYLAIFVFFKDHKPLTNKLMILSFLATACYTISHVIAVNVTDPDLSRSILTFNLSTIFIGVFIAHTILSFMGKLQSKKIQIILIYIFSIGLTAFMMIYPALFLGPSTPKMYFVNYYDAGKLYSLMMAWNIIVALYIFYQMLIEYRKADFIMKNRLKYLFTAFLLAYIFGWQAYWLVFDIKIDPAWGALMVPSFSIIFTYALLKYDLLDIKIVAKKALVYSISVIFIGLLIVLFNYVNNLIIVNVPSFPTWIFPIILSIAVVTLGVVVWRQLRLSDVLKSEFISTVTHKFRTPLTHIRWASENLAKLPLGDEAKVELEYIQTANNNLVELTNLLVNISESESVYYKYNSEKIEFLDLIDEIEKEISNQVKIKKTTLARQISNVYIYGDTKRIKFVIQTLLENAIHYSSDNSIVSISVTGDKDSVTISVKDNGIGIDEKEISLMFSKFHRSKQAILCDTEGMGIGLYISREIIRRHHGKIWVQSEGLGKGSTFFVNLPVKKFN